MAKVAAAKSSLDAAVDARLLAVAHPLHKDLQKIRKVMLGIDPTISEGFKWNSASYRTSDFFATLNLRCTDQVQFVFHTGAKVKASAKSGVAIADPAGLCTWLAKDRCLVSLGAGKQITAKLPAFRALVRGWILML